MSRQQASAVNTINCMASELMCAGCTVFHRSGDAGIGLHGNSGLWRPSDLSHRVALVLYQTELKTKADTSIVAY